MFNSTAEALAARYQALGMLQTRPLTPTAAPSTATATTSAAVSASTTSATAAGSTGSAIPADRQQTVETPRGIGGLPLQTAAVPVPRAKPTAPLGASGYPFFHALLFFISTGSHFLKPGETFGALLLSETLTP